MLEFIQLLKQRYQAILKTQRTDEALNASYQSRIDTLILAESSLLKGQLIDANFKLPLQIAIIGPTQSGKSSVANLLFGSSVAGVSPLAGYTVHPQGFSCGINNQDFAWLDQYFSHFQRVPQAELVKERHDCYSLTQLETSTSSVLPACLLWDTPDFDSIEAMDYREGVLRTAALADIIVLVVSKEKYADQSVWEMMALITPLNQPTLIIVNKLVETSQSAVLNSLQDKWRQARNDPFPEVIPLPYQKGGTLQWQPTEFNKAARILQTVVKKSNRRKHKLSRQQFLLCHWSNWLEPVIAEHTAQNDWNKLVEECVKDALAIYQRDYLNHPHHYETFKNALAELLTLLEIPGLAGVLGSTRKILTWPVKQIFKLGKFTVGKTQDLSDKSQEVILLNQISEHLLIQLADQLLDKIEQEKEQSQWWKAINNTLRRQKTLLLDSFRTTVRVYHADFQQEVETTAHRLYTKLQDQPFTLNSLRATRATTDAAAIALALKTGGIGLHDLIITPAMLSVTSLLAESAIGGYMSRVEVELKLKQLNTVKQTLFIQLLQASLLKLPQMMDYQAQFNISKQQLLEAEQQLKENKHGLRLL
jgi:50S ribosome-binding GTPase